MRSRHKLSFDSSLSPEQLAELKEQLSSQQTQESGVSSWYNAFSGWYKKGKEGVNQYVAKKQVQFTKLKSINYGFLKS